MIILHIIQNLKIGGAQKTLYNLIKVLKSDDHIIITYNISEEYKQLLTKLHNVEYSVINNISEFMNVIKVQKYDIVHYHWWPVMRVMDKYFQINNIPVLLTLQEQCKPPKQNVFYVAGSKENYKYLEDIEEKNKTYIYLGVEMDTIDTKKIICNSPQKKVIGRVSTLYPTKIPDNLIEVFARLHFDNVKLKLLICGTGSEETIKELNLKKKEYPKCDVEILTDSYVNNKYKLMDIFLYWLPDGESESFGLVIIEAMTCGIPVVTKNVGAMSEIIQHGVNGFLFDNESQIEECINLLLTNEELRTKIIKNAKQTVKENFTIDVMAKEYKKLYKKLINNMV